MVRKRLAAHHNSQNAKIVGYGALWIYPKMPHGGAPLTNSLARCIARQRVVFVG